MNSPDYQHDNSAGTPLHSKPTVPSESTAQSEPAHREPAPHTELDHSVPEEGMMHSGHHHSRGFSLLWRLIGRDEGHGHKPGHSQAHAEHDYTAEHNHANHSQHAGHAAGSNHDAHNHSAHTAEHTTTRIPRVVFVGNPNVGKSTLFNAILGADAAVMNAPGTTVMIESGELTYTDPATNRKENWELVDTPGTASFASMSPDEEVAAQTALGWGSHPDPQVLVITIDATAPSRGFYLLSQAIDSGVAPVVALTMTDLAHQPEGIEQRISAALENIPVVSVDGRTGKGVEQLLAHIHRQIHNPVLTSAPAVDPLPGEEAFATSGWDGVRTWLRRNADRRFQWASWLLTAIGYGEAGEESEAIEGVHTSEAAETAATGQAINTSKVKTASPALATHFTLSDRIDAVLLHPVWGILIFLAVMYLVFEATTAVAQPIVDFIDNQVRGVLNSGADWLTWQIAGQQGLDSWVHSLVVDGLIDGIITVLTYVPPMAMVFVMLYLLEDTGYLSRAAFVMNRTMRLIGLDGRAFLPLVVGFGCNLPALAATRTLPDERQRIMTGLLIPFTSCSARLSVYVVLAFAFFRKNAGIAIFAMYVISLVVIVLIGLILRRTQFSDLKNQPFVIALPHYHIPRAKLMVVSVAKRLWNFIRGASSAIMSMLLVIWLLSAIPVSGTLTGHSAQNPEINTASASAEPVQDSFGKVSRVEDSLYGTIAQSVAPVFAPAGFGNWQATAALMSGFVAKEVVVGSLSQAYHADASDSGSRDLSSALRESFDKSSNGHPQAAALAFMVFTLAYTPCLATVVEEKRLFGRKIAAETVMIGLLVAYILAVAIFQIGVLL